MKMAIAHYTARTPLSSNHSMQVPEFPSLFLQLGEMAGRGHGTVLYTAAEAASKYHSSGENRNVAIPLWRG